MAKGSKHSLRLLFFAAFWSAKSGAKTDPPTKKAKRRGLTLAPGARLKGGFKGRWAAERIISDTTLSLLKPASYAGARAFSRAFVSRLRHRAGIVRRGTRREEVQNGPFRNLKPRFLTGRRTGRRAGRSCQSQCKSRFLTGRTREQGRTPLVRVFARSQVKRIFKPGPAAAIGGNPPRPAPSRGRKAPRCRAGPYRGKARRSPDPRPATRAIAPRASATASTSPRPTAPWSPRPRRVRCCP